MENPIPSPPHVFNCFSLIIGIGGWGVYTILYISIEIALITNNRLIVNIVNPIGNIEKKKIQVHLTPFLTKKFH